MEEGNLVSKANGECGESYSSLFSFAESGDLALCRMHNDYLIDREMQRTVSFSGISGLFPQDSAMTESMDTIADRTLEHLVPSDRMIVMTRRRLYEAAWAKGAPYVLKQHGALLIVWACEFRSLSTAASGRDNMIR